MLLASTFGSAGLPSAGEPPRRSTATGSARAPRAVPAERLEVCLAVACTFTSPTASPSRGLTCHLPTGCLVTRPPPTDGVGHCGRWRQRPRSRSIRLLRGVGSHRHRCEDGTPAITCSTCWPQPRHVVLPHRPHRTCEHIGPTPSGEDAPPTASRRHSNHTPMGIVVQGGAKRGPLSAARAPTPLHWGTAPCRGAGGPVAGPL
jgi:hypothetical protein